MSMPSTLARAGGCAMRQERFGGAVATRARSEVFPPPYEVPFRLRRLPEAVALRLRDQSRRARSIRFCSESINRSDSFCVGSRGSRRPAFWENEAVRQKRRNCNAVDLVRTNTAFHFSNVKDNRGLLDCPAGPAAHPRRHIQRHTRPDSARPSARLTALACGGGQPSLHQQEEP
jgi:hypothetical protein